MTCHSWDVACCFPVGALASALTCISVTDDSPIPGLLTVLSPRVPSVHTHTARTWALSTNLQGSSQAFLNSPHCHSPSLAYITNTEGARGRLVSGKTDSRNPQASPFLFLLSRHRQLVTRVLQALKAWRTESIKNSGVIGSIHCDCRWRSHFKQ